MANAITASRIIFSITLLFFPPLSPQFYIFYAICGFTDMIDGAVARKTNTASVLGSRLDTVSDLVFAAVCFIKLFPVIDIPFWIWLWCGAVALIKVVNIVSGFILMKKFVAEHTVMNKITGFLLFLLPFTLKLIRLKYSAVTVCLAATFAAIQEGHFIRKGKEVE